MFLSFKPLKNYAIFDNFKTNIDHFLQNIDLFGLRFSVFPEMCIPGYLNFLAENRAFRGCAFQG